MLHDALRYVRKFHRKSILQTSKEIGVSPSYISEIENGKKRIHNDMLEAYSKAFDMPISAFYLIAESKNSSSTSRKSSVRKKIGRIIEWIAED